MQSHFNLLSVEDPSIIILHVKASLELACMNGLQFQSKYRTSDHKATRILDY